MAGQQDALSILRQFIVEEKEIIVKDDVVILGDSSWKKDARSNYIIKGSGTDGKPKDYYTLNSILFLLQHSATQHRRYVQQAQEAGIVAVRRPDRKDLLAFLNGETSSSANIEENSANTVSDSKEQDKNASLEKPQTTSGVNLKRPAGETEPEVKTKVSRLEAKTEYQNEITATLGEAAVLGVLNY